MQALLARLQPLSLLVLLVFNEYTPPLHASSSKICSLLVLLVFNQGRQRLLLHLVYLTLLVLLVFNYFSILSPLLVGQSLSLACFQPDYSYCLTESVSNPLSLACFQLRSRPFLTLRFPLSLACFQHLVLVSIPEYYLALSLACFQLSASAMVSSMSLYRTLSLACFQLKN